MLEGSHWQREGQQGDSKGVGKREGGEDPPLNIEVFSCLDALGCLLLHPAPIWLGLGLVTGAVMSAARSTGATQETFRDSFRVLGSDFSRTAQCYCEMQSSQ